MKTHLPIKNNTLDDFNKFSKRLYKETCKLFEENNQEHSTNLKIPTLMQFRESVAKSLGNKNIYEFQRNAKLETNNSEIVEVKTEINNSELKYQFKTFYMQDVLKHFSDSLNISNDNTSKYSLEQMFWYTSMPDLMKFYRNEKSGYIHELGGFFIIWNNKIFLISDGKPIISHFVSSFNFTEIDLAKLKQYLIFLEKEITSNETMEEFKTEDWLFPFNLIKNLHEQYKFLSFVFHFFNAIISNNLSKDFDFIECIEQDSFEELPNKIFRDLVIKFSDDELLERIFKSIMLLPIEKRKQLSINFYK